MSKRTISIDNFAAMTRHSIDTIAPLVSKGLLTAREVHGITYIVWDSLAFALLSSQADLHNGILKTSYSGKSTKRIYNWRIFFKKKANIYIALHPSFPPMIDTSIEKLSERCFDQSPDAKRSRSITKSKGEYIFLTRREIDLLLKLIPSTTKFKAIIEKLKSRRGDKE